MGFGFSVKCSSCGFAKHFQIGIGFYDSSLEHIVESLHDTLRQEVAHIMGNHSIRSYEFNRFLMRCTQCNDLTVIEHIKIRYNKGKIFKNTLTCSKCQNHLEVIDESTPFDSIGCPNCGEKTLSKSDELLWD
jgi:predicted RNA-binding Zn-ribbon protein involved in translation (DUF1610 family)